MATRARPQLPRRFDFSARPTPIRTRPASVAVLETHMSYVFLAGDKVYKLKKPVRYPFLDFSTIDAREHNCREEVRLNRRLAADVYLGVAPLTCGPMRRMALSGDGAVVDWLVVMRRLPRDAMLDRLIAEERLSAAQIDALCDTLAAFYRGVERSSIGAEDYALRFFREQEKNRDILTRRDFALDHGRTPVLLDLLDARLAASRSELQERVFQGHVVDGHGDLRPEHICFRDPIAIFDCLEFNAELRQVDPFDELAYLGVECALLGANDARRRTRRQSGAATLLRTAATPGVALRGLARGAARAAVCGASSRSHAAGANEVGAAGDALSESCAIGARRRQLDRT